LLIFEIFHFPVCDASITMNCIQQTLIMNHESHDSKAIHTIHGAIQGIKQYINQYVLWKVIFKTNHDTYCTIHTILTTMINTPLLNNSTPYEKLHDNIFDISNLRNFVCFRYYTTPTAYRKILDIHVGFGIFLGFKPHTKGYIYLNLKNHNIDVSICIIFYENHFSYHSTFQHSKNPNNLSLLVS